jgi:hypothetical protein
MFEFVCVIGSRGLLRHLVHDLIHIKINRMAAFLFPISLVHIVGLCGISLSLLPNHQMVNTRHSQCNGQPSNNNTNNANLEQLLNTQNQLMQAMLQTLNNMQPNQQQAPHLHHPTSLVWRSSCELAPPPFHKPKTTWMQKTVSRGLKGNS